MRSGFAIAVAFFGCSAPPSPQPPLPTPLPTASSEPRPSGAQPPEPPRPVEVALRDDVVVTGGVHGTEPSGAAVLDELKAAGFVTFGPCNPWGLAHGSRYLESGRDLNRSFARDDVPEAEAVKAFLDEHPPGLLLDLHEDGDAPGAYLIQHGPEDDLGRRIVDALRDEITWDPKPEFQVIAGEDGVLRPGHLALTAVEMSRYYGLAFHAWKTFEVTTFVVEVPSAWPAERRERAHVRIALTARRLFSEKHPPSTSVTR